MNVLQTLVWSDQIAIESWFKKETASKLLVLTSFFALFTIIAVTLFFLSRVFFLSLTVYESYTVLLVGYLIHASVVILLWFTIASTTVASITFLHTPSIVRKYLITLPVASRDIILWLFVRSTAMNLFFLSVILGPILLSFATVFLSPISPVYILQLGFVLFILVLLSGSIGGIAGLLLVTYLKNKETIASVAGVIFFLTVSYSIIRFIFPGALFSLYDAPNDQFNSIYNTLPLVRIPLLTAIITQTIISGFGMQALYLFVLTAFIILVSLYFQSKMLVATLQKIEGSISGSVKIHRSKLGLLKSRIPLVVKNWYCVTRSSAELGYGLFLLSLTVFFFLFLYRATTVRQLNTDYAHDVILFTYVWFLFFSIAYLLRLVYPLMSKEGTSLWYIFTQPIRAISILHSHFVTGLLLSVPLYVIAVLLWSAFPLAVGFRMTMIGMSIILVIVLTCINVFLGAVSPNFSLACDPEKVSTSFMGLFTFLISATICVGASMILGKMLSGTYSTAFGLMVSASAGIILLLLLYAIAKRSLSYYDFSK